MPQVGRHAEVRIPRDEFRNVILRGEFQTLAETAGPRESSSRGFIVHGMNPRSRQIETPPQRAIRWSAERLHGVADRPVACAPAKIPAQSIGVETISVPAELFREHADDEAGCAVSALRSAALRHSPLHLAQAGFRQRFHSVDFATGGGRKGNQTTIDRLIRGAFVCGCHEQDCTGAALTFSAAFLRTRQPTAPDVVEKRDLRCYPILPYGLPVQDELEADAPGPHDEFYCISGPRAVLPGLRLWLYETAAGSNREHHRCHPTSAWTARDPSGDGAHVCPSLFVHPNGPSRTTSRRYLKNSILKRDYGGTLDGWWRSRAIPRLQRRRTCRESGADQRRATPHAEDGKKSGRPARSQLAANRPRFYKDITLPFYGYNRPGAKISEGIREHWWLQGMMGGHKAHYDCIKAFSETDFTEDLKEIDIPVLVMYATTIRLCRSAPLVLCPRRYSGARR